MGIEVLYGAEGFEAKSVQGVLKQEIVIEGDQTNFFTGFIEPQDISDKWGVIGYPTCFAQPSLSDVVQEFAQVESYRGEFPQGFRVVPALFH